MYKEIFYSSLNVYKYGLCETIYAMFIIMFKIFFCHYTHRRRPPWSRFDEDTNLRASSGSLEGSSEMLVFAFNLANLRETSRNKVKKYTLLIGYIQN